jgi:CRP/FNR family transcriptional regulator
MFSMATDKIAALRETALFGSLTEEELLALAFRCTERRLSREEVLFFAGEEARGLYVYLTCRDNLQTLVDEHLLPTG